MYIVAIAWIYVVLMMSITEESIIAGLVTFALYGILPLTIILYIMGSPQRKRQRLAREAEARSQRGAADTDVITDVPAGAAVAAVATDPTTPDAAAPAADSGKQNSGRKEGSAGPTVT